MADAGTATKLRILCLPFHNGLRNVGMGAGAIALAADDGLRAGIEAEGWHLTSEEIEAVEESDPELRRVIELVRRLARSVRQAATDGAFPLVVAGNCNSALGTTAGIGADKTAGIGADETVGANETAGVGADGLGVVWFDAHADFDDPEENESGFFDVMGLAMLTGRGWRGLRRTIPGHLPIPEQNVILAGVRDLEPYQRRRLAQSKLMTVPNQIDLEQFDRAVRELADRVSRVYLHVDLDSIDIAEARANAYAAPGGPTLERLSQCIERVLRWHTVAAAAITAYDPAFDPDGRTISAARRIARQIAAGVRKSPPQPAPDTS